MSGWDIRYCRAADGTSIAWTSMGSGPLLLHGPPGPIGHIAGELRVSDIRTWYERLARSFTIVRYDPRGAGSSDRDRIDESQEARVMDLEAVALAQGRPLVMFAQMQWARPFSEFAARHPEIVTHLIVWNPILRDADNRPTQRIVATRSLIERDWRAYTDAWAQSMFGWRRADSAREWARCFAKVRHRSA